MGERILQDMEMGVTCSNTEYFSVARVETRTGQFGVINLKSSCIMLQGTGTEYGKQWSNGQKVSFFVCE